MQTKSWLLREAYCLALAFVIFLSLLFGVFLLTGGIASLRSEKDDFTLTDWKFIWSGDKRALEGDIPQWLLATAEQPVRKSPADLFRYSYVRLRTTLPSHAEARILELITASNPIKVWINGEEIYNNRYDMDIYTGNRINDIPLPPSTSEAELDVFLRVPYSFSLTARLTTPHQDITIAALRNMIGLVGSGVMLAVGLILVLALLVFALKNKGIGAAIWLSFMLMAGGVGAFMSQLSLHSTSLTSPLMWKVQLIILLFTAACLVCTTVIAIDGWKLAEKLTVFLILALTLAFTVTGDSLGPWMMAAFPLLLLMAAMVTMLRLSDALRSGAAYARLVTTAFLVGIFCEIFDTIILFAGWGSLWLELRYAGLAAYGIVQFFVLMKRALHFNVRLEERELQIDKDNRWVEKTITCCAGIFAQQNISGFCRETAHAIKELVLFDHETNNNPPNRFAPPVLRISMALIRDGEFDEIYTENQSGPCDYSRIVSRAQNSGSKPVVFSDHTLDMLLYTGKTPVCILHIEGIKNGISINLKNTLRSTYTGITAALNGLELKNDIVEVQENVFINLAEIAEQKESGTGAHLRVVAEMVAVLCDALNLPEHEKHIVSMASMVHDIGKLAIPETILCKKGKLNEEEYALMQDHVIYGYNILSKSPGEFMAAAAIIAQQHHEKYDGTGYLELRGDQIHLYARIVAIADVFDALLSERSYKIAWTPEQACAYIGKHAGTHFDPYLVGVFNHCKDTLISIKRHYL